MNKKPDLIISSLDQDRLYELLESLPQNNYLECIGLEEELARAKIVAPNEIPPNRVTMNSCVKFRVESTKKEFELILAYPKDIEPTANNKISVLAPVGSALIGLSIGDSIEWSKLNGDILKVEIINISYQPEREGVFHR